MSVIALVLALLGPASATPLDTLPGTAHTRATTIDVRYEPGLESTARDLRDVAASELARISEDLVDLPAPREVHIQVVRDAAALPSVAPAGRGAPPWAIGVAYPDLGVISVATRRGAQLADATSTLRHELAHLALGAALGDRAPHWLHEGFAYQHSGEWSFDRAETLAGMAWFNSIVPLEDLDRSFPAEEAPAHRAYAESYDFVGYLARRGHWEDHDDDGDRFAFRRFLTLVGQGVDLDHAAHAAYGKGLRGLFDEWREDLGSRYLFAPIGLIGLGIWVLCAILLALAWRRRRRLNRARIAQWDHDERSQDAALARLRPVIVPPYVPWPGEDPFAEDDDSTPDPELVN